MQSKDMNREDKDDQDGFSISSLATIRALLASSSLFLPTSIPHREALVESIYSCSRLLGIFTKDIAELKDISLISKIFHIFTLILSQTEVAFEYLFKSFFSSEYISSIGILTIESLKSISRILLILSSKDVLIIRNFNRRTYLHSSLSNYKEYYRNLFEVHLHTSLSLKYLLPPQLSPQKSLSNSIIGRRSGIKLDLNTNFFKTNKDTQFNYTTDSYSSPSSSPFVLKNNNITPEKVSDSPMDYLSNYLSQTPESLSDSTCLNYLPPIPENSTPYMNVDSHKPLFSNSSTTNYDLSDFTTPMKLPGENLFRIKKTQETSNLVASISSSTASLTKKFSQLYSNIPPEVRLKIAELLYVIRPVLYSALMLEVLKLKMKNLKNKSKNGEKNNKKFNFDNELVNKLLVLIISFIVEYSSILMSINALEDIRKSIQTEVLNTTLELVCQTSDKHIIEKELIENITQEYLNETKKFMNLTPDPERKVSDENLASTPNNCNRYTNSYFSSEDSSFPSSLSSPSSPSSESSSSFYNNKSTNYFHNPDTPLYELHEIDAEIKKRKMCLFLYLLRSPIYSYLVSPTFKRIFSIFSRIPLVGSINEVIINLLDYFNSTHFYHSNS